MNTQNSSWGVIFDVDGTLVNNTAYHRQAWFDLCERYAMPLTNDSYHAKVHARSNDKIVPNLFGPQVDAAFIRKIELEKEMLYQDTFRPVMCETPGLTALLTALNAAGIPCAAASNSPKTNVDFVLDGLNLRRFFSVVFCRDDVAAGKPNPEVLLKSAAGMNLPPVRCLLFEDSSSGFAAARNAQMPYIAITCGADAAEQALAHDAKLLSADFTTLTLKTLAALMNGVAAH